MGMRKPSINETYQSIQRLVIEIKSPYNDGFTASACKYDLFLLKSWLDDVYATLPHFQGEEQWHQQRTMDLLRRPER
jgi:hypothetical protein